MGKSGLGGLDVSDDDQFIFVMSLGDRTLYRLPTTGALNTTTIQRTQIPLTNPDTNVISAASFNSNDLRPFAVEYHQGQVYVGVIYTAETSGDEDELLALVYTIDPNTMVFNNTPVFQARLNYTRSESTIGFAEASLQSNWEAWRSSYFSIASGATRGVAPQPMFTGIAFDEEGNMTLGIRDRGADQIGFFALSNPNTNDRIEGFTAGEVLQAFINTPNNLTSGWTLENNGRGPNGQGAGPQNTNRGPGGAEFYHRDRFNEGTSAPTHGETSIAGVLQLPGRPDLTLTIMDPGLDVRAGGVSWFDNSTGDELKRYQLYDDDPVTGNDPFDLPIFGKANGLGDLIALCMAAPIEIGNRVWLDLNYNGIQDAGEMALQGITVQLTNAAGTVVLATATTDANGNYYFSSDTRGTTTGSKRFSVNLQQNTDYRIQIDTTQAALAKFSITKADADATANGDRRDSDGKLNGKFTEVKFTTGDAGSNNHSFDFGFHENLSLGNRVFNDANNDGQLNTGETGVANVTVNLYQDTNADNLPNGAAIATTNTDTNGYYLFTKLAPGDYIVEILAPAGFISSSGTAFAVTGPFENAVGQIGPVDPDNNLDSRDDGQTFSGQTIRSNTVTLSQRQEPTGELDIVAPNPDNTADNNSNLTVDFGIYQPLNLGNRVFDDVNNNGTRETTEVGINNVTIKLFQDADGDNVPDGAAIATTTTDANGYYLFTNLLPGKYIVEALTPTGYVSSTGTVGKATGAFEAAAGNSPIDPDGNVDDDDNGQTFATVARSKFVTLAIGTEPTNDDDIANPNPDPNTPDNNSNLTVDFGFFRPMSLGNRVFDDRNNNGLRDAGEAGINGVEVKLYLDANNDGTPDGLAIATTTTDANGYYLFTNLVPNTYIVESATPTGFLSSTGANGKATGTFEPAADPNNDTDDNDDGSTNTGVVRALPMTLKLDNEPTNDNDAGPQADNAENDNSNRTVDFGFYRPLNLGNRVFEDANNNGLLDAGETGIANVEVKLFADADGNNVPDGAALATSTTDANGYYLFKLLGEGKYIVEVTTPAGFTSSTGTTGAATGPYEAKAGNISPIDANNDTDNDDNGQTFGAVARSRFVTLTVGGEPTNDDDIANPNPDPTVADNSSNLSLDFGFFQPLSLGNLVFDDINNNGVLDAGELGVANVTVRLFDNAGNKIATTTTGADGKYLFNGLSKGTYQVEIDLPAEFISSTGTVGSATGPYEGLATPGPDTDINNDDNGNTVPGKLIVRTGDVTLTTNGEPINDGDADNNTNLSVDFGIFRPMSLGNRVFNDANNNGIRDAGEVGINGVEVKLYLDANNDGTPDGAAIATTNTDANGYYLFTNLVPDTYIVESATPAGFLSTTGANGKATGPFEGAATPDPDADATDSDDNGTTNAGIVRALPITLKLDDEPTNDNDAGPQADNAANDNSNRTVDFGFFQPLNLGNRVFEDVNNNGLLDAGDTGIANVTVNLFADADGNNIPDGAALATTTTDANGYYLFKLLGEGKYIVEVTTPAGFLSSTGTAGSATGPYEAKAGNISPIDANNDTDNDDNGQTFGAVARSRFVTLTVGGEPTNDDDIANPNPDPTVADNNSNLSLDFGFFRALSLGNLVFDDVNNSGVLDAGELGVANVTVRLFDNAGNKIATTTTGADGKYLFNGLSKGTYQVEIDLPAEYISSTGTVGSATGPYEGAATPGPDTDINNDDNGNTVPGKLIVRTGDVTLTTNGEPINDGDADNNTNLSVDFGIFRPMSLGNRVFNDANNNGKFDAGEAGINGVEVKLYLDANNDGTPDGAAIATTTTDANGYYLFTNLVPDTYIVESATPAGFLSTTGANGKATGPFEGAATPDPDADATDSDDNGTTNAGIVRALPITLKLDDEPTNDNDAGPQADNAANDNSNRTVDFGFFQPLNLGNRVFEDANNNGLLDAGETGIANVTVNLFADANADGVADGAALATTTTDANGYYLFKFLGEGKYFVEATIPTGFFSSTGNPGAPIGKYEAAAGQPSPIDVNGDADNDDNGQTFGTVARSTTVFLSVGGEPTNDDDIANPNPDPTVADNSSNLSLDFGFFQPLSLGNLVFDDINNNGKLDAGENGVANVNVRLLDNVGNQIATTKTGVDGKYLFTNLVEGTYQVEIDLPAEFISSTGTVGSATGPYEGVATPDPDTDINDDDNGNTVAGKLVVRSEQVDLKLGTEPTNDGDASASSNLSVDFGIFRPMSLGNRVFNDANNNGKFDAGEVGLANLKVEVFADTNGDGNPDGPAIATVNTDANGYYLFTNLVPGDYVVQVTEPTGKFVSSTGANGKLTGAFEPAADPDDNLDNDDNGSAVVGFAGVFRSGTVTLKLDDEPTNDVDAGPQPDNAADDNSNRIVDFGFFQPLSLGNLVFEDANNNGKLDAGENGVDNIKLTLRDEAGNIVTTTMTANGGKYLFTNLIEGKYQVEFDLPANFISSTGKFGSPTGPNEPAPSPEDNMDGDDNGSIIPATTTVQSQLIELKLGTEPLNDGDLNPVTDANSNFTLDFGIFQPLSLGNLVFEDLNNNGKFDASEVGLANVKVNLYLNQNGDGKADTNQPVLTTTTDANGFYLFTQLPANKYIVEAVTPTGYTSSTGAAAGFTGPFENPGLDANNDQDNIDDGVRFNFQSVRTSTIVLAAGTEPLNELTATPDPDAGTPDANSNLSVDFGFFRPLSLGNLVFNDVNNDGIRQGNEAGVAGVSISLFDATDKLLATTKTDANGDYGFFNLLPGDYYVKLDLPANFTSSTGRNGKLTGPYEAAPSPNDDINNDDNGTLIAGTNSVRSELVTLKLDSEPTNDGDDNSGNRTVDFGIFQPLSLGNLIFNDPNNNGKFDAGETGIANVTVRLLDDQGKLVATTTTDADGKYRFDNLGQGDYSVEVDVPAGFRSSTGTNGSPNGPVETAPDPDNNVDADDNGTQPNGTTVVRSTPIRLETGLEPTNDGDNNPNSNLTVDFGFFQPMTLGNRVFNDTNNNGKLDAGEVGLAGVKFSLFADADNNGVPDGAALATTFSDAQGYYKFTDLTAGNYVVEATIPAGFTSSTGTLGSPTGPFEGKTLVSPDTDIDSDDSGNTAGTVVRSGTVTLKLGQEPVNEPDRIDPVDPITDANGNLTVDFGFFQGLSLGNLVFNDVNNNGKLDAGETGIAKVTVRLFDNAGNKIGTTTTDDNGKYLFTNLTAGDYQVEIDLPAGFVSSTGVNGATTGPAEKAPSPENNQDSDDNGSTTTPGIVRTQTVTLTQNGEPTNDGDNNPNTNLSVDFGIYQPLSLGNLVFEDLNNNGVVDPGEPGLANVKVKLLDPTGKTILTTTTDANGKYRFDNLVGGDYQVEIAIPTGFRSSSGQPGSLTGKFEPAPDANTNVDNDDNGTATANPEVVRSSLVTLVPGNEPVNDGDTDPNTNLTVDFGVLTTASLVHTVFIDGNGKLDPGETVVPNVEVFLLGPNMTKLGSAITDANGKVLFDNLTPGTYNLSYNLSTLPPALGFTTPSTQPSQTSPVDSDIQFNNMTTPIFLPPATQDRNSAGGLVPLSVISGYAYVDNNQNGVFDPQDTPLANIPITLVGTDDVGRQIMRTTVTDTTGLYFFDGLRPGTYQLSETQPEQFIDAATTPGTFGGMSSPNFTMGVPVPPGAIGVNYNFGEIVPATITGSSFVDTNNNGRREPGEPGIPNVPIRLTGVTDGGVPITRETTTDPNGFYIFDRLPSGTYQIAQTQPQGFIDGRDASGTLGGLTNNDLLTQIILLPGQIGVAYDFGEIAQPTSGPSKRDFLSSTNPNGNNGTNGANGAPVAVVAGARVTNSAGNPAQTQSQSRPRSYFWADLVDAALVDG